MNEAGRVYPLNDFCLYQNFEDSPSGREIVKECLAVADMLLEKNRKYGDSALNPRRTFSRADPEEQIRVRMDDKLNRIENRQDDDDEDVEADLLGYLVLARIARKRREVPKSNLAREAAAAAVRAVSAKTLAERVRQGRGVPLLGEMPEEYARRMRVPREALAALNLPGPLTHEAVDRYLDALEGAR